MTTVQQLNYTRLKNELEVSWLSKEMVEYSSLSKKYYVVLESEVLNVRWVCLCSRTMKLLEMRQVILNNPSEVLLQKKYN